MNVDDCIFCRMARDEMKVDKLYEDDLVFAIYDINPRAPTHILIITREHILSALHLGPKHAATLGRMYTAAAKLAKEGGVADSGFRLAVNCGDDAGQTVYHLHMHLLAGRRLGPEG